MQQILAVSPLSFPWQTLDPFLFCAHHLDKYPGGNDRFGIDPAHLKGRQVGNDFTIKDGFRMYHGDAVPGFPQHPHRGFETITLARQGFIDHSDSMGAAARFGHGDIQWMTAGRGIVHSEMFPLIKPDENNTVELFQIWLNLPAANKMCEPYFSMYWSEDIKKVVETDKQGRSCEVAVYAGQYNDTTGVTPPPDSWASKEESGVTVMIVRLEKGARFTLPAVNSRELTRVLYFFEGSRLNLYEPGSADNAEAGQVVDHYHAIQVNHEALVLEAADDDCQVLLLQGKPLSEPVAQYGPFVMNTREEIQQAFAEYQQTGFGGWPWPDHGPVHGGKDERFARHIDGRVENPPV